MLADGIYRIFYQAQSDGGSDRNCALAIFRDGQITGSDKHGGVYLGTYEPEPESGRDRVNLRLVVPPGGVLVTGFSGGTDGIAVDIAATLDAASGIAKTVVEVAGQPVDIELTYIGPLPI